MTYISAMLTDNRESVKVWSRNKNGDRIVKEYDAPYYFYVEDENGDEKDLFGTKLTKLQFDGPSDFFEARRAYQDADLKIYESDIPPEYKTLSKEFYGSPIGNLNVTFFDIEVDYDKNIGYSSIEDPYAPVSSIAIYHWHSGRTIVLAVPPENRKGIKVKNLPKDITDNAEITICKDEVSLLKLFFKEIDDSDIISGWNSDFFDVPYIYERANIALHKVAGNKLCFSGSKKPFYKDVEKFGTIQKKLCIHGRISLDYLDVYKKFEMSEKSSYKLEHVAEDELPHLPKLSYDGSLYDLYRDDFEEFLRYNIRDTVILQGLEEKKKYIKNAIQMSHMATTQVADVLGTIKVAEMSIINYCHDKMGAKVPDHAAPESTGVKYAGATVIDPKSGMHKNSASVDLVSLYPSVMRSLNISPETLIGQFIDGENAFNAIREGLDEWVVFIREADGKRARAKASDWLYALREKNWIISGSGTVFHQDSQGVIPSILTTWFAERKAYKKKMGEAKAAGDKEGEEYWDRMQYIKKIQLNSMYGATGNRFFKFFDIRLAESTTLSARQVLYHMASKIAEILDGTYDMTSKCVIYGDTDSVYFLTYRNTPEEALETAVEVCGLVNDSYPDFMTNAFNCDSLHNGMMRAEQEIVSDNGIYIKKKYYILHTVFDDGKPVDKMKNMGVPIKKTTLPPAIKRKLSGFIEDLLKGGDWDIIGREVVAVKDELLETADIAMLGLPKGINKLEEYTDRLNSKEEKLMLPGHVSAAILWNKCIYSYKDNDSPKIISGSKLSVYYLKRPIGRFKSIAVPKDAQRLPDWFVEHFVPRIDRAAQIERLIDKPMEIMISAAGIKVPTKKRLKLEEGLFG
jgi:DNA polymerase elongation subunit (family B)